MTPRGAALLLGGVALLLLGRLAAWPELTALGGAALGLLLFAKLLDVRRVRAELELERLPRHVTRDSVATVRVRVTTSQRSRRLSLVLGSSAVPVQSVAVGRTGRGVPTPVEVPLDTRQRGVRPAGPWMLVQGDPWGLVRRVVATVEGGMVTVHPRTHPVPRLLLLGTRSGDSDVSSRRPGDEHFHALRDYVLGDEPRSVHWRSSARAGKLVVRQHVSAASDAVVVLLDVDSAAYGSGEAFGSSFQPRRFEEAVDVAASLAAAQRASSQQVHLATTARAFSTTSATSASSVPVLDALAVVDPVSPVDAAPDELRPALRRLRAARLLVVSGDPERRLLIALQSLGRDLPVLLVRVGGAGSADEGGVRTQHVASAAELGMVVS